MFNLRLLKMRKNNLNIHTSRGVGRSDNLDVQEIIQRSFVGEGFAPIQPKSGGDGGAINPPEPCSDDPVVVIRAGSLQEK